ncbi:MAG: transcription termination/antitermination protein NusG, partial [Actinomycetota bacterium]
MSLVTDFSDLPADDNEPDAIVEEVALDAPVAEDTFVDEVIEEAAEEPVEVVDEPVEVVTAEALLDEAAEGSAEASEGDEDGEEAEPVKAESPYDRPGQWFVIHSYSGYEKKVKSNLESRIASMNMEDHIYEVVIPEEDVIELKNGRKVVVTKKMFPGYLLVRCELDDDSWYVVRNTPGVTGFVGSGAKPTPLRRKDVENFL